MNSFDAADHPRDNDGRFTAKRAREVSLELSADEPPHSTSRGVALGRALDEFMAERSVAYIALQSFNSNPSEEAELDVDEAAIGFLESAEDLREVMSNDDVALLDDLDEAMRTDTQAAERAAALKKAHMGIPMTSLERNVVRVRALDPDDQVFGPNRQYAESVIRAELAEAKHAYETGSSWEKEREYARLRAARQQAYRYNLES